MRDNLTPEKLINDVLRNIIGFQDFFDSATSPVNFPKYEILKNKETKEQLLRVLLAGYKKSDISIQKGNGRLIIKHDKKNPDAGQENNNGFEPYGQTYIAKRAFKLEFKMNSNVKIKSVTFEDGILSLLFDVDEDENVVDIKID
jgi:HSP20 family molecular chaperone IbpA